MTIDFTDEKSFIIDSFTVSPLEESIEILNFKQIKNELVTLIFQANAIRVYKRTPEKNFIFEKSIVLNEPNIVYSFFKAGANWYVFDVDGYLFKYDSLWNLIDKKEINLSLKVLKSNNRICESNNSPIKIIGDTIISNISNNDFDGYADCFKEQPYIKFKMTNGRVVLLQQLGHKPYSTAKYFNSMPVHCFTKNEILTLYPCFDTIYRYNLTNDLASKVAINNPEYKLPAVFPVDSLSNFGYIDKYQQNNFMYAPEIAYNPITDHFVVFYYKYIKEVELKKREPEMHALVLDGNLKKIKHIKFDKAYSNPESAFYYEGKGIALSIFKNSFDFETTTFHIFNF